MDKAKILTTTKIKQEWLDEINEHIPDIEFEIHPTKETLQVWFNPMQNSANGVFAHLRQLVSAPTGYRYRVYVMTKDESTKLGITSHLAMYDHLDRDGVIDFYICLPSRLTARAKANGFRSNFAWIFVHESLHGKEQENSTLPFTYVDRVHDWEAEGRLLELLAEHKKLDELKQKVSLLQKILELTKTLNILKKKSL